MDKSSVRYRASFLLLSIQFCTAKSILYWISAALLCAANNKNSSQERLCCCCVKIKSLTVLHSFRNMPSSSSWQRGRNYSPFNNAMWQRIEIYGRGREIIGGRWNSSLLLIKCKSANSIWRCYRVIKFCEVMCSVIKFVVPISFAGP